MAKGLKENKETEAKGVKDMAKDLENKEKEKEKERLRRESRGEAPKKPRTTEAQDMDAEQPNVPAEPAASSSKGEMLTPVLMQEMLKQQTQQFMAHMHPISEHLKLHDCKFDTICTELKQQKDKMQEYEKSLSDLQQAMQTTQQRMVRQEIKQVPRPTPPLQTAHARDENYTKKVVIGGWSGVSTEDVNAKITEYQRKLTAAPTEPPYLIGTPVKVVILTFSSNAAREQAFIELQTFVGGQNYVSRGKTMRKLQMNQMLRAMRDTLVEIMPEVSGEFVVNYQKNEIFLNDVSHALLRDAGTSWDPAWDLKLIGANAKKECKNEDLTEMAELKANTPKKRYDWD